MNGHEQTNVVPFIGRATKPANQQCSDAISARQMACRALATSFFQGQVPISFNELNSLYALMGYVAADRNMPLKLVRSILEAKFHVSTILKLPVKEFNNAVIFLADLATLG
jgi:hypothetical protein